MGHLSEYNQFNQIDISLDEYSLTAITKPGIPAWRGPTPADALLARYFPKIPDGNVLLLGCGPGISATIIAKQVFSGNLWATDLDILALDCARQTIKANHITNCTFYEDVSLLPEHKGNFSVVVLIMPKGRKLSRRWLVEASELLEENGELYLVGAKSEGIQSVIHDTENLLMQSAVILGFKKGYRIASFRKGKSLANPEWRFEPGISPGTWHTFPIDLGWTYLKMYSLPGVFSYQHLDEGTKLLLDHIDARPGDRILDVGCGYGILGLAVASLLGSSSAIDFLDSNLLAVACTNKNLLENIPVGIRANCRVIASDLMAEVTGEKYHYIISNPPFHSGKNVDYSMTSAMIQQASRILAVQGRLILVANKFIRYDRLLKNFFDQVSIRAENPRYHILEATRSS